MHIVVLGAGAVGGYFGAKLAKAGTQVTFLVRERRFQQLSERGLRVHSALGDFAITPLLATDAAQVEAPDVVIVAVKNYHLQGALPSLKALTERGARILPLLNGVNHIEWLRAACGRGAVLGGTCFIEATLDANGDVVHGNQLQDIIFGRLPDAADAPGAPEDAWLDALQREIDQAGIHVTQSQQVQVEMWQKYIFLTTMSAITAATRQPIGVAINDEAARAFLEGLIAEMTAVAGAAGVNLPDGAEKAVMERLEHLPKSMTSSLHRDLEKGLPLELDSLQGAAIETGERLGVPTPNLRAVYALLHPYKDGNLARFTL
jgi:2-dehydropantoate 2-reductase